MSESAARNQSSRYASSSLIGRAGWQIADVAFPVPTLERPRRMGARGT